MQANGVARAGSIIVGQGADAQLVIRLFRCTGGKKKHGLELAERHDLRDLEWRRGKAQLDSVPPLCLPRGMRPLKEDGGAADKSVEDRCSAVPSARRDQRED